MKEKKVVSEVISSRVGLCDEETRNAAESLLRCHPVINKAFFSYRGFCVSSSQATSTFSFQYNQMGHTNTTDCFHVASSCLERLLLVSFIKSFALSAVGNLRLLLETLHHPPTSTCCNCCFWIINHKMKNIFKVTVGCIIIFLLLVIMLSSVF